MNINKVQPIQYSPYEYWKKYKAYGHRILYNYTSNIDIHEDFDSRLYICLEHLFKVADYSKICKTYIVKGLRNLCNVIKQFGIYTYKHEVEEVHLDEYEFNKLPALNIALDDFVEKKFFDYIINKLQPRQQLVIRMNFGLRPYNETTLVDIAKILDVSPQRVRFIRGQAIRKLKKILKGKQIYSVEDFING